MLKFEVYPVPCFIQTHWGGVGQFNLGQYGHYQKYLTNLNQTIKDIEALKVMKVYQILFIYMFPGKEMAKNCVSRVT